MANYYFDANALLKYSIFQDYKFRLGFEEKGVEEIRQLVSQSDNAIFYSSLTLLEAWNVLFKTYRKGSFGKIISRQADTALQTIVLKLTVELKKYPFTKLDAQMNESVVSQAHLLIDRYGMTKAVASLDMLHIALVKSSSIESLIMVSSDNGMKNVCSSESINLFDPEKLCQ